MGLASERHITTTQKKLPHIIDTVVEMPCIVAWLSLSHCQHVIFRHDEILHAFQLMTRHFRSNIDTHEAVQSMHHRRANTFGALCRHYWRGKIILFQISIAYLDKSLTSLYRLAVLPREEGDWVTHVVVSPSSVP